MRKFISLFSALAFLAAITTAQAGFVINSYMVEAPAGGGGAIPTFVAVGAGNSGTGNVVFDAPAGIAANDILWLVIETNATETVTAPTGFAHVTGSPSEATDTIIHVMWKRATGSETTVTVTDPGNHMVGQMYAFRGCTTTGNPWDATSASVQNTASTSVSIAGTTTTVANTLVVLAASTGRDTDVNQFSGWANASLANLTERGQFYSAISSGGGEALVTGEKAVAGATGTTTSTLASSDRYAWVIAALKP